eukprot:8729686-Pyramimonas_sp.AAC.2
MPCGEMRVWRWQYASWHTCSHDEPIRCRTRGYILTTNQSGAEVHLAEVPPRLVLPVVALCPPVPPRLRRSGRSSSDHQRRRLISSTVHNSTVQYIV